MQVMRPADNCPQEPLFSPTVDAFRQQQALMGMRVPGKTNYAWFF
jgi:hypothetical protein